jgi:hypothetical protein
MVATVINIRAYAKSITNIGTPIGSFIPAVTRGFTQIRTTIQSLRMDHLCL